MKECNCLEEISKEEIEAMNKGRIERKLNKIYEAILDVQDRMDAQTRHQREEELKMQQARIEDEKISLKMYDYDYEKRKHKLDYFNEKY